VRATLAPAPARAVRLRGGAREAVEPGLLVVDDVVAVGPGDAFPRTARLEGVERRRRGGAHRRADRS
jgi:hypothetical protein